MHQLTKWLKIGLLGFLLIPVNNLKAQTSSTLSLEDVYDLSRKNYPLIQQQGLISKTAALSVDNLRKGLLPQLSMLAQASYQSEVTQVRIPVPGVTIDPLSKDQYKLVTDLNQVIYDGGMFRSQKDLQIQNAAVETNRIEVDIYKLKERVSQLYLGILFIDEQLKQADLIKADINNGIKKVEAQVANGIAFRSNLNLLQAELLKADQRVIELQSSREGFLQALGLLIGKQLPADQQFHHPGLSNSVAVKSEILRPELQLFAAQDKMLQSQLSLIKARNTPKASFFTQGGYAKPGLNFLKNQFDFYFISGFRVNWTISSLYTSKKEKELVEINRRTVQIQKETFLLNTNSTLIQQKADLDKLSRLIQSDQQIIDLRVKVKEAAKAQLENGVITANDYLREVNAEDLARQNLIAHQLQLLQAQINFKNTSGQQ